MLLRSVLLKDVIHVFFSEGKVFGGFWEEGVDGFGEEVHIAAGIGGDAGNKGFVLLELEYSSRRVSTNTRTRCELAFQYSTF